MIKFSNFDNNFLAKGLIIVDLFLFVFLKFEFSIY